MALVGEGDWIFALILMMGGTIWLFSVPHILRLSLLSLVPPERIDTVSSQGYALGYLGGGLLLAANLLFYQAASGNTRSKALLFFGGTLVGRLFTACPYVR